RYVLEDPALLSLPDGRRLVSSGHASGGVSFDIGATSGGQFHRSLQSSASSLLRRRDRHALCAPSALGRVGVSQVPPLRENPYGGTPSLVDSRSVRIQRAYHSDGHWPPSGLLVFLAATLVRGRCPRAQMAHRLPGRDRVVCVWCRPRRQ